MVTIVDDKNLGYSLGAADYLTKPIDREAARGRCCRNTDSAPAGPALVVDDDETTPA